MRQFTLFLALAATAIIAPAYYQGGPNKESTETVAKPRRPATTKDGQPARRSRNNRKFQASSAARKVESPKDPASGAMSIL